MPREEMVKTFGIERIGKSPAVFDKKKLLWMNGQYIRKLPLDTLIELVEPYMPEGLRQRHDAATLREIVAILQDSIDTLADFPHRATIFDAAVECDGETRELLSAESAKRVLASMVAKLKAHPGAITPDAFKQMILATGTELGLKGKDLYFPIRGAMTGSVHGPDLTRVAAVKGKDNVLHLLQEGMK
jgi:nondiscriminating glutamyl-tRNA synthetase